MRYADFEYYAESFLAGSDPVVPEGDFPRWEREAELEMDAITHGRIASFNVLPAKVKDCACAVTEVLYKANKQSEGFRSQGLAGPLASWSNDGQSGSVDLGQSVYTESGKKKETLRLCRLYLAGLGLMYAGVVHYES